MEKMSILELKGQVFDIQSEMQELLISIQPVQDQIQELDKKRMRISEQIKKQE